MKRLLAALTLFAAACATAPEAPVQSEGRAVQLATSYTLHSNVLGEDREINVWTPPGYAEGDQRHTVLYLVDGGLDQDFPHIAGLGQLGAVSYTYDQLIIVGVKTGTRIAELTPPTSEPTLFNDYIAVSPSLWWDDRVYARAAANRIATNTTSGRRLYLSLANEGGTMLDGVNIIRAAADAAADDRLTLRFADRSAGETHATTFHPAALDALRWLYAAPPYDYGPAPWWMTEGASPPPAN